MSEGLSTHWAYALGLLGCCLLYSIWLFRHNHAQEKAEELFMRVHGCKPPPSWHAKFPLGLDLLIRAVSNTQNQTLLEFFVRLGEQFPLTHKQNLLFESNLGTHDVRNIEAILSSQFEEFDLGLRPAQFAGIFGPGSMMTQDGLPWLHSRKMLQPFFASNRGHNFEEIQEAVERMLENLPTEGIVDLQPVFCQYTFDTSLNLLFGDLVGSVETTDVVARQNEFAQAFSDGQEYLTWRVRLGGLYWLCNTWRYRRTCATIRKFVDEVVDAALLAAAEKNSSDQQTQGNEPFVLLKAMMERTEDRCVLRDQCLSFLLAGRDSTACSLTWAMFLLIRHPRSLAKLRGEIMAQFGPDPQSRPSRASIQQLAYLDYVVKESLRLYPPFPINVRAARVTTTLPIGGGEHGRDPCFVRRGEAVTWAPYVLHRRHSIFGEDAREFRPERWAEERCRNLGYAYIPFGGGKRSCLGQDLALMQIKYTLTRLIQHFPVSQLPDGYQTVPTGMEKQLMTLIVSPAEGCVAYCKR